MGVIYFEFVCDVRSVVVDHAPPTWFRNLNVRRIKGPIIHKDFHFNLVADLGNEKHARAIGRGKGETRLCWLRVFAIKKSWRVEKYCPRKATPRSGSVFLVTIAL